MPNENAVVRHILVFGRTGRPGPDALMTGAKHLGIKASLQRPFVQKADGTVSNVQVVFVDGIRGDCETVRDMYKAINVPVYILELPRLRAASGPDKTSDTRLVGTYLYDLNVLTSRVGNSAVVNGVMEDRDERYILVCGQKPNDSAHGMNAEQCAQWARETIAFVQMQYGYPVCYRPHPRAVSSHNPSEFFGADYISFPTLETIHTALSRAHACVTFNSTSGVDAIDCGVPVLYTAPDNLVGYCQYAGKLGDEITPLGDDARRACLLRYAAMQWTLQQLRDGTALRCLLFAGEWPDAELIEQTDEQRDERDAMALALAAEFAEDARQAFAQVDIPDSPLGWIEGAGLPATIHTETPATSHNAGSDASGQGEGEKIAPTTPKGAQAKPAAKKAAKKAAPAKKTTKGK